VAELLKDRVLIGHAVHNDLKALLLSHPYPLTRDTQVLAYKAKVTKSKRVALRNIVKEQLDLTIQSGEHSSVCSRFLVLTFLAFSQANYPPILSEMEQ
jgi:RNA exonuclease 4